MANTLLLDFVINDAKKRRRPLSLVSVDLAKAFDSVGHRSLTRALFRLGVEPEMVSYVMNTYLDATTSISCGSSFCGPFPLTRGVKQGDPLSPILFNAVIDELLDTLPDDIGIAIDNVRVNVLAFADDLYFLSESEYGMRRLLSSASHFFEARGLRVNVSKCHSLVFRKRGKTGQLVIPAEPVFTICDLAVRSVSAADTFKYLGVTYAQNGKTSPALARLDTYLLRLSHSCLKPQQKLIILKTFILSRFTHVITLSTLSKRILVRLDTHVRAYVRKFLRLPHYTPVDFFYTSSCDGGLGLTSFAKSMPFHALNRLTALVDNISPVIRALFGTNYVSRLLRHCQALLGPGISSKSELRSSFLTSFSQSVYGSGLRQGVPSVSNHWLGSYAQTQDARFFLKKLKLRLNLLSCKGMPSNRGDRLCRAGCGRVESLSHISQACTSVSDKRIERHNRVLSFLERSITLPDFVTMREPTFSTNATDGSQSVFKPDLVLISDSEILVIDVGICWETPRPLALSHTLKARTYDTPAFKRHMLQLYPHRSVSFYAFTLSGRGLFASGNSELCTKLNLGRGFQIKCVSIVMEQSIYLYQQFMKRAFSRDN